jgi:DNA-binding SARP family transcriptional activator
MDFRILGPLEALDGGRPVALGGSRQRALLALLLLHANEAVGSDRLIEELWGEPRPAGAAKTLQVSVSRLRKALAEDIVVTHGHGYELRLDPERVDAHRFAAGLAQGRSELAAGRPERAAAALEAALALWRGPPLDDLAYEPWAQREIARLQDQRVAAHEQLVEARLALGRHAEVLGELETLIAAHPYREGLRRQLMLALYRCDRQADALQAYQDARHTLVEELGIEPGERLRELEAAILAQAPALAAPDPAPSAPSAPPAEAAPAARRPMTIVVAGLAGAPALAEQLDPEAMHALLDRVAEACGAVIERHGGTVQELAGDTILGVFGQERVHEDDGLRAVRAVVELRGACAALEQEHGVRLGVKVGAEAGEAFVAAGTRRAPFAAGGAFGAAARLERAAAAGELLLGDALEQLVRGAVRAERAEPEGWRLLALDAAGPAIARSAGTPFVGRAPELAALRAAFDRAREARGCVVATVIGPAGMGKSRLAHEFAAGLGEAATVLTGRCPSYGDGVTYRPLAEIVGRIGGSEPRARIEALLGGDADTAQLVLAAVGLAGGAVQAEEAAWAVRRLLEAVARERPLVVVMEDIHWAEPTLLDLLDHLAVFSRGTAMLLLCLARPDLLETRPGWAAPQPGRSIEVLGALAEGEARALVDQLGAGGLAAGTAEQIVARAEGNPLFLEHLAAVGADTGELPSSLRAVLAARIDGLEPAERALLEHAAVQGRSFHAAAPLLPEGTAGQLVALVRKGLIGAERSELAGQDAFRFAHVLLRDAAYRGVPKQRRAELHERVARWLERQPRAGDEAIGHHLVQAHRYRAELGRADPALAAEAAGRLAAAAEAALLRGDASAGARLLEDAAGLLDADAAARAELLPALGAALFEAGRIADAARVLDAAVEDAPGPRLRARAVVERELVRLEAEPGAAATQRVADAAHEILAGDVRGRGRVWQLRGQLAWDLGRAATADAAWEEAGRAGGRREQLGVTGWRALAAALGPAPVDEAIRRCEGLRAEAGASPLALASTLNPLALLHAMLGEVPRAEALLAEAGGILRELGGLEAGVVHLEASVRLLAGQPERAEAALRAGAAALSSMSAGGALATTTALLAQAVLAQGRHEEALALCRETERRTAPDDAITQALRRGVEARIRARAGEHAEAEALAREAVALVAPTDLLSHRGDAMLDLAEVLRRGGRPAEADDAVRAGLACYERKGNAAAAARARALLDRRQGGST